MENVTNDVHALSGDADNNALVPFLFIILKNAILLFCFAMF